MATTSDKLENQDEATEDIGDILSSIKDVITSSSPPSNVLVLTEQVEDELEATSANDKGLSESTSATSEEPTISEASQNLPKNPDILEQLDADSNKLAKPIQNSQDQKLEGSIYDKLLRDDVALAAQATISSILEQNNANTKKSEPVGTSLFASKSFEDVAIALLRTELQGWLNDNLPDIVKSIVENEIKRIMPK